MAGSVKIPKNPAAPLVTDVSQAPGVRDCLTWFSKEKSWIHEQHLQLCRIPAPTFLEQKRAEWMVERFRSIGYQARIDRGGNVIAQLSATAPGPFLALTAHLDTVLAPRNPEEILLEADGTMRGAGVSDNGAGLAALLAIARALADCSQVDGANSVLFVATVGEEGEGNLS